MKYFLTVVAISVMLSAVPAYAFYDYENFNYGTGDPADWSKLSDKPAPGFTRLISGCVDKDAYYSIDGKALGSYPLPAASEDGWVGSPKNTTSNCVVYYRWDAGAFQAVEGQTYVIESKVMGTTYKPYSDTWDAGFRGELFISRIPGSGADDWANYSKIAGMTNSSTDPNQVDVWVNGVSYPNWFNPGGVQTNMTSDTWYEIKIVLKSIPGAGNDTAEMYTKRTGIDPYWVLVNGPNLIADLDTTAATNVPIIGMYQWYTTDTHGYNHAYGVVDHLSGRSATAWLSNNIGVDPNRVLKPWTPLTWSTQQVNAWGRTISWNSSSLLPASITTAGVEMLTVPMRMAATVSGVDYNVPLDNFVFTKQTGARVEMTTTGSVAGITFTADMHMDFDGFLWVQINLDDSGASIQLDKLTVEALMASDYVRFYQCFSTDHVGRVGTSSISLPWTATSGGVPSAETANFYHWFGTEELGLGFTYETMEHWKPISENAFCKLYPNTPDSNTSTYVMNILESPAQADGLVYKFGIQATPIKPLPADYHSMVAGNANPSSWHVANQIPDNIDFEVIWSHSNGWGDIMQGLNDSENFQIAPLTSAVNFIHGNGVALVGPAITPQKIQNTITDFNDYFFEWKRLPESSFVWNWQGTATTVYQNCAKSQSYVDWLVYTWQNQLQTFNLDGVYFDGWLGGQMHCNNPYHGCGWLDGSGVWREIVPVLESREAMKRFAIMLEDTVNSPYIPADEGDLRQGFPKYHFWVHSWNFATPIMGFATDWYTGEFAWGIQFDNPPGGYAEWLGKAANIPSLDMLKSRCLSTNYGLPNIMAHNVISEGGQSQTLERQTKMVLAWELPHGVPAGKIEMLNQRYLKKVYEVMRWFRTRHADFIPAWNADVNPYLEWAGVVDENDVFATWARNGKVLAVVSNLRSFDDQNNAVNVSLKWKGFNNAVVFDALTQTEIPMDSNGLFTLPIAPETFQLLWIQPAFGDFDWDFDIDLADLAMFVGKWLTVQDPCEYDANNDSSVNFIDYASLMGMWTWSKQWPVAGEQILLAREDFNFGTGVSPTWNYIDDHDYHLRLTNTAAGSDKYGRFAEARPRVNTDIPDPNTTDDNWVGKTAYNTYPDGVAAYRWMVSDFGAAEGYEYILHAKVASNSTISGNNGIVADIQFAVMPQTGTDDYANYTTIARIASDGAFNNLVAYKGTTAIGTPYPAFDMTWYELEIRIRALENEPDRADFMCRAAGQTQWTTLAGDVVLDIDLDTFYSRNCIIYGLRHKYLGATQAMAYIDNIEFYQKELVQP